MRRLSIKVAFPVLLGLASSIAVACGDNSEPPEDGSGGNGPTDISTDGGGEPGSGGNGSDGSGATSSDGSGANSSGSGAASNDGSGATNNNGGEGGQTGTGGVIGTGGFVEVDLPDCSDEPNGEFEGGDHPIEGLECWDHAECKGVASEQFLNRCSDGCLEPFDNEDRIDGFTGTLPPL